MFKTLSIAAAVSLATLCAPALAADHTQNISKEVVGFSDLNIQTTAGAQALIHRIKAAARRVCGPAPDMHDLDGGRSYNNCLENSTTQAMASINDPLVATLGVRPVALAAGN